VAKAEVLASARAAARAKVAFFMFMDEIPCCYSQLE